MGNQAFSHTFYLGNIQDSCIIGLDLERWCVVVDIVASWLCTNFGTVTLCKPKQVPCLALPLVWGCADSDSAIEQNQWPVEELLVRSSTGLMSEQQTELRMLVDEFTYIFATKAHNCTHTNTVQHEIDTGDVLSIRMQPQSLPFVKQAAAEEKLEEMRTAGVVEPSDSC